MNFKLKIATQADVPLILRFINELAVYEKLAHEVIATEQTLTETLFGPKPFAEVIIGYLDEQPVAFALFFHNYSTFLSKPGIYLEDLYVREEVRNKGIGQKILSYLAKIALERNCGRIEWSVLNWNSPAIDFYKKIGAKPMDEWTVYRLTGESLKKLANISTDI